MDLFNFWTVITAAIIGYYFIEYKKITEKEEKIKKLEMRIEELEKKPE